MGMKCVYRAIFAVLLAVLPATDVYSAPAIEMPKPVLKSLPKTGANGSEKTEHSENTKQLWSAARKAMNLPEFEDSNSGPFLRLIHIPSFQTIHAYTVKIVAGKPMLEIKTLRRGANAKAEPPSQVNQISPERFADLFKYMDSSTFWKDPIEKHNANVDDGSLYLVECTTHEHPFKSVSASNIEPYESLCKMLARLTREK